MEFYEYRKGVIAVLFYVDDNSKCEVFNFIIKLEDIPRKKVIHLLDEIATSGLPSNRRRFEPLKGGPVCELKTHYPEVRLFCFRIRDGIVITHCDKKPKPKILDRHIERTLRIKEDLEERGLL